ncbi:CHAD-like protein, partial [Mya arenaria]
MITGVSPSCPAKCQECNTNTGGQVTEAVCQDTMIQNLPQTLVNLTLENATSTMTLPLGRFQSFIVADKVELENLKINNYGITRLDGQCFVTNTKLITLDLSNNRIEEIHTENFAGLLKLKSLSLNNNNIRIIERNCFQNMTLLTTLQMAHNKIMTIEDQSFKGLRSLVHLSLQYNSISSIHGDALQYLQKLKEIDMQYNNLQDIPNVLFKDLVQLRFVNFSHNRISCITSDVFQNSKYDVVDLSGNNITDVDENAFQGTYVFSLDIQSNNLKQIPRNIQNLFNQSSAVFLRHNPWSCDCNTTWLLSFVKLSTPEPQCHVPESLEGTLILDFLQTRDNICKPTNAYQTPGYGSKNVLIAAIISGVIFLIALIVMIVIFIKRYVLKRKVASLDENAESIITPLLVTWRLLRLLSWDDGSVREWEPGRTHSHTMICPSMGWVVGRMPRSISWSRAFMTASGMWSDNIFGLTSTSLSGWCRAYEGVGWVSEMRGVCTSVSSLGGGLGSPNPQNICHTPLASNWYCNRSLYSPQQLSLEPFHEYLLCYVKSILEYSVFVECFLHILGSLQDAPVCLTVLKILNVQGVTLCCQSKLSKQVAYNQQQDSYWFSRFSKVLVDEQGHTRTSGLINIPIDWFSEYHYQLHVRVDVVDEVRSEKEGRLPAGVLWQVDPAALIPQVHRGPIAWWGRQEMVVGYN